MPCILIPDENRFIFNAHSKQNQKTLLTGAEPNTGQIKNPAFTSIASAASLLEPGQHLGTRPTLSASPLYMRGAAQGMFLAEPSVLVTTLDSQKRIFWNQINDLTPTTYYVLLPTLSNLDHCKVGTPALLCQILLMTLGVLCAVSFFAKTKINKYIIMSKFDQQNAGRVVSPGDTVNVPRLSK